MRNRTSFIQRGKTVQFALLSALFIAALGTAFGQTPEYAIEIAPPLRLTAGNEGTQAKPSEYVSIQVDGGTMRQVLNAFAIQTKRNVVIGPEVTNNTVSIHLNNVRWDDALEVILKPYGYGYRRVGDTIVISRLDKLASLAAVEPLETRVFELSFLDASDVKDMLEDQLSVRGSMSIMQSRGQKGWAFASQRRATSRSGVSLSKRLRVEDEEENAQAKSKTIVVSDIPSILDRIGEVLDVVDQMPKQILVEAKFVEANDNFLRDIGMELGGTFDVGGNPITLDDSFFGVEPNAFNPATAGIAGDPLNTFGSLTFTANSADLLISMLQEDDDSKILSAPSILTLNNQEATIIVGEKFPIIESDVSGSSGDSTTSTTLDYYENIGIQLNVVPQISGDGYINMIVHPSVSSIEGFETGTVASGAIDTALTRYPRINIRETETQILLKNTETVVIGGLLEEREVHTELKVPFLGDIPILGWLFKRDTVDTETVNLLIFISATIVDENNYDIIVEEEEPAESAGLPPLPPAIVVADAKPVPGVETILKDLSE